MTTITFVGSLLLGFVVATWFAGLLAHGGFPLPAPDRRIGQVDGLRGYLALAVMAHHFYIWVEVARFGQPWAVPTSNFINELGATGVALFFMTTGLVFYPRVRAGFMATSWSATLVTRIFRIIPLTAVSVLIITVIVVVRTGLMPDTQYPARAYLWLISVAQPPLIDAYDAGRLNAYVLWSLHFEWIFYIALLPVAALTMDGVRALRGPSWVVPVGLLVILLAGAMLHLHDFFRYAPLFAVGMLAFECQGRAPIGSRFQARWMAVVALAALAAGMITTPFPYGRSLPLFTLFFVSVACGNDMLRSLTTLGARVLGECSFGIYMLHGTILSLLFVEGAPLTIGIPTAYLPLLLPVVMVSTVAVAAIAFRVVERPMIAQGARIARHWTASRAPMRSAELEVAP